MHRVLIVDQREVPRLLPMGACIEAMSAALVALARAEAAMPLRQIVWRPDRTGALGLMPSRLDRAPGALGAKIVTFFPKNEGTELDSHQGAVLLFEADRGRLLAVIDATSVTAIRTAAVSAVATRALARPDAGDLALIGSGVQARTHLEALAAVRPLRSVRVAGQTRASPRGWAPPFPSARATRSTRRSTAPTSSARSPHPASRSSAASGSPRARTSTPSARASPRTGSSTPTPSSARDSSWTGARRPS